MIYMVFFWIVTFVTGFMILSKKYRKNDFVGLLVMLQLMFFVLAIATKDPILPTTWGIDPWWELTIEGITASFTVWKTYLNPLKNKVYSMDREIGGIKSDIITIKEDTSIIKNKLIK